MEMSRKQLMLIRKALDVYYDTLSVGAEASPGEEMIAVENLKDDIDTLLLKD